MDKEKAISIIESLANGVDPVTGEIFPSNSPYNHPDVIRALFFILRNGTKDNTKRVKKTIEEKQQINLEKGLPRNYGLLWSDDAISYVISSFQNGLQIIDIAEQVERKPGSIIGLLKKKEIISEEEAFTLSRHLGA
ncbi:hypothetical protein [Candidatus Sororendozoicomonas aggregata]|uniref:hypothetical protein n=1 Tax=Candidatus Sororendozoicomonas aggregata TaxID=3073239 RepID=UPI002ED5C76E